MKKKSVKLYVFCLVGFILISATLQAKEAGKILIASQESEFKQVLTDNLKSKIDTEEYEYSLIDFENLSQVKLDSYDSVVIINQTQWLKPNKIVVSFVKNASDEQRKKIIVLSTTGSKNRQIDIAGVDTMTSASEMNKIDKLTDEILSKIKNRL